ncbi:MAG: stage III sporulation protein AD [Dethiobacteria bacterium]|jgi:stage III sporulation protein AD
MEIIQVVVIGLVATALILIVKEYRPEIALQLSIVVGILILSVVIGYISEAINVLISLAIQADINLVFLELLFRVIGIAYIAEFGSQVCRDAGEGSIAGKIEFAAKTLILVMSLPIIRAVMENIVIFLP